MSSALIFNDNKVQSGGGGCPPMEPRAYGDGGGGRGDDAPDYGERLRRCRLGMALALAAIVVMFVCVTAAYILRYGFATWDPSTGLYVREWQPLSLPMPLLIVNTVLLVVSSITLEVARRREAERVLLAPLASIPGIDAGRRQVPWLAVSTGLGMMFLAGQLLAWRVLSARGFELDSGASSAFFYFLTATHAIHLLGGLIALVCAGAATTVLDKSLEARRIAVDVTAWYWHVMAVLWVYIFVLLVMAS
ncbi:MAG: heme-copper oxidase subunit III [Terriglobales bacterium]